jgi:hypothetical protein
MLAALDTDGIYDSPPHCLHLTGARLEDMCFAK